MTITGKSYSLPILANVCASKQTELCIHSADNSVFVLNKKNTNDVVTQQSFFRKTLNLCTCMLVENSFTEICANIV